MKEGTVRAVPSHLLWSHVVESHRFDRLGGTLQGFLLIDHEGVVIVMIMREKSGEIEKEACACVYLVFRDSFHRLFDAFLASVQFDLCYRII